MENGKSDKATGAAVPVAGRADNGAGKPEAAETSKADALKAAAFERKRKADFDLHVALCMSGHDEPRSAATFRSY